MKSIYDKIGREELQKIINESSCIRQVIEKIGLSSNGSGGYVTFKKKVIELKLDLSIFSENRKKHRNIIMNKIRPEPFKIEDILIENSNYSRMNLKRRLLKEGILKNVCYKCGLEPIWNDKTLTIQLHHKNGKNNDNRLENLEMVCPNCHSQLKVKKVKEKTSEELEKERAQQDKLDKRNKRKKQLIEIIINSNIDFTKLGWVIEVSKITGIKHQKVSYWMKKKYARFL